MIGTTSSTIHSGLLAEFLNAEATFSRLTARACFWPLLVLMICSSSMHSASRSICPSRSRIHSAPMPPRKYSPQPNWEPKRSLSSRKVASSGITSLTFISWKSFQTSSMRSIASSM